MFGIIKVPRNFSATVGWMLLWWTAIRTLFLFCLYSWITLLRAAINNIAPFMHYIYSLFIANKEDKSDNIDTLISKLQKLLSYCMFFMAVDAIFQIVLIYASNKKSYMWMLPWVVYSFMSLIILTITPIDFYYRTLPPVNATGGHVDADFDGVLSKFSTYFIYLSIQLLLLIAVFENFQSLRVNKSYYYLKQAVDIEKDMIITMLDLYEKSILNRFATTMNKKIRFPKPENTEEVVAVDVDAEYSVEPTDYQNQAKSLDLTTKF